MAAGWVSALSFSFVSVVFGCYKAVNQVNHNSLFASCRLALSNFPVTPASQPSPGCAGLTWQLTVWRVGRSRVSCLHFGLGCAPAGVCTDEGSPSVVYLNFSFPLKWHNRGPAWLMSPHLHTLLCPKRRQNIWNTEVLFFVCFCLFANQLTSQPFELPL